MDDQKLVKKVQEMAFLLGFDFQADRLRPDLPSHLRSQSHGRGPETTPQVPTWKRGKASRSFPGQPPKHNAWQRYYKMAKGFRGWAFWTSGKIKVHFKMPSRNSVASLPTLGADGCTSEFSLFPETWWLRELGHLQDECPHPLQTLVRGWQTEACGSGVTAKVKRSRALRPQVT